MALTIKRRGKIWHYSGTVAGRLLRGSTGTQGKETAQRIAADLEARQWKGRLDGPEAILTFAQAATYYRKARKSDRFLKPIEDHWQETLVKDMTGEAIRGAAMKLYPNAGPPSWNRQVIVPTQAIINHSAKLGFCQKISVERFKMATKERTPVTQEWVLAFMDQAEPARVGALCCFMFSTGARVSEALGVEWAHVDLARRRVLITMGKRNGDQRWAHLPPPLFDAIANLPGERDGLLFGYRKRSDCWTQWRNTCDRAGIQRLGYHACRHGFATTLLHRGIDVNTVAKLGGWKTPALVLKIYGHAQQDPTLSDVVWACSPTPQAQTSQKLRNIS